MTNFEKVGLFMRTFGQEVKKTPGLSTEKINNLRIKLLPINPSPPVTSNFIQSRFFQT